MTTALTRDAKITDLFLKGNPVDTIAAAGRERGWNRADCLRVASENGWTLDPTGRIPRAQRTPALASSVVPAPSPRPAVGADVGPGRAQIAAMLGKPGPAIPSPEPLARMIADGKAHSVARVRRLAEKADRTLAELRRALAHEAGREQIRRRLAELDAERDELRAKLGGTARTPKERSDAPAAKPAAVTGDDRPISHGTWGGFLAHRYRGETVEQIQGDCPACFEAKATRGRKTAS